MKLPNMAKGLGQKIGGLPKSAGNFLGEALNFKTNAKIGRGFGEGVAEGFGGGQGAQEIGGHIGAGIQNAGMLGLLGNYLAPKARDLLSSGATTSKSGKPVSPEETKWREKATKDVMNGLSGDFTPEDLSSRHASSDEGWRSGLKGLKKEEFNAMAKKTIDSGSADDVRVLWNTIIRNANKQGKNVNTSKPLYLPATFNKNGKKMSYAMMLGDDKKPRLVPIEMGKGVSFED